MKLFAVLILLVVCICSAGVLAEAKPGIIAERIRLRHLERRITRRVVARLAAAKVKQSARAPITKPAGSDAKSNQSARLIRAALAARKLTSTPAASAVQEAPVPVEPASPVESEASASQPAAASAPAATAAPTPTTTQVPTTTRLPPALVAVAIAQGINLDDLLALTPAELTELEAYLGLT